MPTRQLYANQTISLSPSSPFRLPSSSLLCLFSSLSAFLLRDWGGAKHEWSWP